MSISAQALEEYRARRPEPKLEVRGKDPAWLRDIIKRSTGLEFTPKTPWRGTDRDQRQLEAVAFALLTKQVLLHYGMRTGKTKISLDWLQHLVCVGWVRKALIVPHAPVGVDEWERQIPTHSDLDLVVVRSGSNSSNAFVDALEGPCSGVVTTWSTLQQIFSAKRPNRRGKMKLYADKAALRDAAPFFQAVVVDEIHQVNDPGSLRFDLIAELAPELLDNCGWRLGLTGTPFGRDPFGLWSQARIVDGGQTLSRSYYFFAEAFGKQVYNHFSVTKKETVFDPKSMPVLQAKLNHMVLTCTLEEIQDTNVIASTVQLRMGRQQARAYRDLVEDLYRRGDDDPEVQNIFVRLRQVSSGYLPFVDDDGNDRVVEFPDCTKMAWLEDFFSDLDPTLKVVVFHEFIATGAKISEMLTRKHIRHSRLWGGTKDRRGEVVAFQTGEARVLVANHASGGTAIDLSAAEYMCVVESPVGFIGRQQMLARPLARGSRPLVVDDLVCSPVEAKILAFHAAGRELNEMFRRPRDLARELE